jgi:membrane-associated protease RseP (regulator of RpoE activity)
MNFLIYDIAFLVIFLSFIAIFLYVKRKNVQRDGLLFLYRTQIGIKAIDYFSSRYKNQLKWLQYVSIAMGYFLMLLMMILFLQVVYIYVSSPETVDQIKIPPVMPLIPYLPSIFNVSFLPPFYFTYWIIILAIVAISHEFAHGIFARFHKLKVKSTGFGFLGPFLAAFVEPDEKEMEKRPIFSQISILSAGTFANILIALAFVAVFIVFFYSMFIPAGALFNTYTFSSINITQISQINGKLIDNPCMPEIIKNLDIGNSNNLTRIKLQNKSYLIDNNFMLSTANKGGEIIFVFDDLPAINANISGVIVELNGAEIKSAEELGTELGKYKPGDSIIVKTKIGKEIKEYNITLASSEEGKAYMGIGLLSSSTKGIKGKVYLIISWIRHPGTYYESRFNEEGTIFFQDFLWWMILINFSVALVNMLPLGIFDGGRVFYLTILYFTKSEDKAKKAFKFMTMFLLFLVAVIMLFWIFSIF